MSQPSDSYDYEIYPFEGTDWCPNNQVRPTIIYRSVHEAAAEQLAQWFEKVFAENGWPPAWRYTVYDFAHYHSNTHEVIGVFRGHATIRLGDTAGESLDLKAGDVVIIPAGVSHQRLSSSEDFTGVGAYPDGFDPDQIRKDRPNQKETADPQSISTPEKDPLGGLTGALQQEWPK